ncbi:transporter substrate-binding domain-containing protein [Alteromonas sp. 5E99-2]|uniref:diguanylate cyclase domain-containing protein n=1 Tax=Alteromonas sp. 5E99-2 TaxID=2817683 RepID=UPI001A9A0EA4|nr:transporter substrate-binding domain-containing protein [Alteromonas sp. 5E99-2]
MCLFALLFLASATAQIISSDKELRYCVSPDRMPFEGVLNNKHVGISKDYIDYIGDYTNIDFKLVVTSSLLETSRLLKNGTCDVVFILEGSFGRDQDLLFTHHIFESPNVLITRIDFPAIPGLGAIKKRKVAVEKRYRHMDYLTKNYPGLDLVLVKNEEEGLLLVNDGKVDVMISSLLSASIIINERKLDRLIMTGYAETNDTLVMGFSREKSGLYAEINQTIESMHYSFQNHSYRRWYRVNPVLHSSNQWVGYTLFIFVVAIIILIWIRAAKNRVRKELSIREKDLERLQTVLLSKNREIEFLSTQDELTSLNNRSHMLHKIEDEICRFNRFRSPVTLILIQIETKSAPNLPDTDEQINHPMTSLSEIVVNKTRDVDILSRWSSDEILIACPQTNLISAQMLAERILTEVELQSLQDFAEQKISIGIGTLNENDDFSSWLNRVSAALRSAKKQRGHSLEVSDF